MAPTCEMTTTCTEPVAMMDNKGFVYCAGHGMARRAYCPCRKLRSHELHKIARGETITKY